MSGVERSASSADRAGGGREEGGNGRVVHGGDCGNGGDKEEDMGDSEEQGLPNSVNASGASGSTSLRAALSADSSAQRVSLRLMLKLSPPGETVPARGPFLNQQKCDVVRASAASCGEADVATDNVVETADSDLEVLKRHGVSSARVSTMSPCELADSVAAYLVGYDKDLLRQYKVIRGGLSRAFRSFETYLEGCSVVGSSDRGIVRDIGIGEATFLDVINTALQEQVEKGNLTKLTHFQAVRARQFYMLARDNF